MTTSDAPKKDRVYIAIDLKSFYASVECYERGLDPLTTNLVVADASRTEKTICRAVSPSLKAYGIPGRARLFEVNQKVREVNALRLSRLHGEAFSGSSVNADELASRPDFSLDFIAAVPRMALYIQYSSKIYNVYLKYIAADDIHVYSIDEVFMDVTDYLTAYNMTPQQLASRMICDVYETTGITAAAGIGTNLYLAKIAMDIEAKHVPADENGVRIAQLDELSYRKQLWSHRPLTDFWRVGRGYAEKLEKAGLHTMGDIALCSIGKPSDFYNEDLLYKMFGVNAQLLIDHAWGWEPCTIADIRQYEPQSSSVSSGQVLQCPYSCEKARIVVQEMLQQLSLDLVSKGLVTDQIVLTVGYDIENLADGQYTGDIVTDRYGRKIPKHTHGTVNLEQYTSSTCLILDHVLAFYDSAVNSQLKIRRLTIAACHLLQEDSSAAKSSGQQISMFADFPGFLTADSSSGASDSVNPTSFPGRSNTSATVSSLQQETTGGFSSASAYTDEALKGERQMQDAMLKIREKFGKNAILTAIDLEDGATAIERNKQIGGHKA